MPILVSLLGGRKSLKQGHYDFGVFGVICNVVSICKYSISSTPSPAQVFLAPCEWKSQAFSSEARLIRFFFLVFRLVSLHHSTVQHAFIPAYHTRYHELCLGGLRGWRQHFSTLVLCLGSKELQGSSGQRGRHRETKEFSHLGSLIGSGSISSDLPLLVACHGDCSPW